MCIYIYIYVCARSLGSELRLIQRHFFLSKSCYVFTSQLVVTINIKAFLRYFLFQILKDKCISPV